MDVAIGLTAFSGSTAITLDADLQFRPGDLGLNLPTFWEQDDFYLLVSGYTIRAGIRTSDGSFLRLYARDAVFVDLAAHRIELSMGSAAGTFGASVDGRAVFARTGLEFSLPATFAGTEIGTAAGWPSALANISNVLVTDQTSPSKTVGLLCRDGEVSLTFNSGMVPTGLLLKGGAAIGTDGVLTLDGQGDYAELTERHSLEGADYLSVKLDFRFADLSDTDNARLIWNHGAFGIRVHHDGVNLMFANDKGGQEFFWQGGLDILDLDWHHIDLTIDPVNSTLTFAIDGQTLIHSTSQSLSLPDTGRTTTIGSDGWGSDLNGQIDNVVLSTERPLPPEPIVNSSPMAADDTAMTVADMAVIIDVLANDSDPDGDALSVGTAGGAAHGSVSINPDGTLTYTPDAGFSGIDSFSYTVLDGSGGQDTAQVMVHVGSSMPGNPHDPGDPMHGEHEAVFNLVKHADATHVAVNSGSWFDPNTWAGGAVPGDGAKVLIAQHARVDYDGVSNARLFTVRVDGELAFATGTDSRMVVDTLVVDPAGKLTAGTAANPVAGNVNVDIIIANNGAIDTAWDPTLISRGIISHGTVEIHGQEKTTHLKVAQDPMAGDTSMLLSETPLNWQVGDTIVLTGTRYDGYVWEYNEASFRPPQDEVLTITAINGQTVHFDRPLQFDHDTPRADLKASVANYTRNVSVETEDAATAATHERGHVMFMHSDQVDVRFAEFHELGRTDKSIDARNASEFGSIASDSNVKGRYAFHLHKTGVDDAANPAIAEGNAVFGSPGWGFVHHSSNAILHDNATYNTFGAGYVAESGNETGTWSSNIAIYAKGRNWGIAKNQNDAGNFDTGRGGDGFFFQGRMVESMDNIAASVNHGFTYFHRGRFDDPANGLDGQIRFDASLFDLPDTLEPGLTDPNKPPILNFIGNEAFAANEGLHIVKHNPYQGFDVHSRMKDFTAWEVNLGAYFDYTGHYSLEDFDLTGKIDPARDSFVRAGMMFSKNAVDMVAVNPVIANFQNGFDLLKDFSFNEDPAVTQYKIVNPAFSNIANQELLHFDPNIDEVLTTGELVPGRFAIDLDGPLYFDPTDPSVKIFGTKTDSIGTIDIPAGTDGYDTGSRPNGYNAKTGEILSILENEGYYSAGGKNYFVLEDYYSERATGEIFKFGYLVEMAPDMAKLLGNDSTMYANAVYRGQIDLNNRAPVTGNETVSTPMETDIVIGLLQNDSDPDGDAVWIDGIVQPEYGRVFDHGDGTVTYRPYLDFQGAESFKYWVTDSYGAYTEAWVTVDVVGV